MYDYKKHTRRDWLVLLLAALLWGIGLTIASFWDLQINQQIYDPQNAFGIVMEAVGWYPLLLPTLMLALYYCAAKKGTPLSVPHRIFWWAIAIFCFGALFSYSYRKLLQRGWLDGISDPRTYLWLAGILLVATLIAIVIAKASPQARLRVHFIGLTGTVLAAGNLIVITLIKTLWQRTRFSTLIQAGSLADFTPWYSPFGNGGESFPSGHVANAVSMLLLVALCDVWPKLGKHRVLMYVIAWGYIAAMACARLILGAHYLSDVLMSSAIVGLLFYCIRRQPWYKKAVSNVLSDPLQEVSEK